MKKILILGAGIYQAPLILAAKEMGLFTIVCSIPGAYPGFALADKVYLVDTTDKEAILQVALEEKIDGVCTSGTDVAVATIGYLCQRLGLSGMTEEAARRATDKALMKDAFQAGGVSAAAFRRVCTLEEAKEAAEAIGYPVVVKRVDSSGSRGITIVKEPAEIEKAYTNALSRSRKNYVLVEECLKGTEIGVDGVVQNGKLVFVAPHEKYVYKGDFTTIPMGHAFPYVCSPALLADIEEQMQRAVTALGLDHCSVNADVFVNGDRAYLIEMGGRTGATCIPELISLHYGFDFYRVILENALGLPLTMEPAGERKNCRAKLLMSPVEGTITKIDYEAIDGLQKRTGCSVVTDYPVGHRVQRMIDGTDRIGHLIACTDTEEELDGLIAQAYRYIEVNGSPLEAL